MKLIGADYHIVVLLLPIAAAGHVNQMLSHCHAPVIFVAIFVSSIVSISAVIFGARKII